MTLSAACPICGKPPETAHRPFCSKRCRDVDLHRWVSEGYRIPGAPVDEAEDAPDDQN